MRAASYDTPGTSEAVTLYVVATPLGNLADLSQRAADVLRAVPLVAAEDTRRARKLLNHLDAHPRVLSYHAHSPLNRVRQLERELVAGTDIAILTDAGTPSISDPGAALVARARALEIEVSVVPGPSAVSAALSVSGLPADRYTFFGFLPRKGKERNRLLAEIASSPRTVVLFEAANRLTALLADLAACCGLERTAVVARELTKLHEEVQVGNLEDLRVYYQQHVPRGEVTLVLSATEADEALVDLEAARTRADELLAQGLSRRDVATRLAAEFSMPRREAYRMVTQQ